MKKRIALLSWRQISSNIAIMTSNKGITLDDVRFVQNWLWYKIGEKKTFFERPNLVH